MERNRISTSEEFDDKVREAMLRWFRHVQRRDYKYIGQRSMPSMELSGRRKRGRPQRRFIDLLKKDMQVVGVTEQDTKDRMRWNLIMKFILKGTPDF